MPVRILLLILLLIAPGIAICQVVQPAGAPTTAVNWQSPLYGSASFTDVKRLDLNGDGTDDVAFSNDVQVPTGQGQATRQTFGVTRLHPAVVIAADSFEWDSAKRYQAGELIHRGISWGSSVYLDYVIIGNGGTGGRGFFRDGVPGFVVARMAVAGEWRYWWIHVESRSNVGRKVNYYGASQGRPLAATPAAGAAAALGAFPNPATAGWQIQTALRGTYQLFDTKGRLVSKGPVTGGLTEVRADNLPAGLYHVLISQPGATPAKLTLVKE